jgi:hypothetical protein
MASTTIFPAGQACSFPLKLVSTDAMPQVVKQFVRPDGTIRILTAAVGSDIVFSRADRTNGPTFTATGSGAVNWLRLNSPDFGRLTLTGHWIVFYFPGDTLIDGVGPSTLRIVGREDIDVRLADFQFTERSRSGQVTDVCAAVFTP